MSEEAIIQETTRKNIRMFRFPITMLLASLFLLLPDVAQAAVITIEGTVKSVDAKKRTITVQTKTKTLELDVSRKAKISVKSETAKLDSLKVGQKVTISYHDGLEIVLKIEVSGAPADTSNVELLRIREVSPATPPWVSYDGNTILWKGEDNFWIAHRDGPASLFSKKTELPFGGNMPTLSQDGLTMVFLAERSNGKPEMSLHTTNRKSIDSGFSRPHEIRELRNEKRPWNPCLSPDCLTLFYNRLKPTGKRMYEIVETRRRNANSVWGTPRAIPIERDRIEGSLAHVFMMPDRKTFFCTHNHSNRKKGLKPNLMVWTRRTATQPFSDYKYIEFESVAPISGSFPRYVENTKELFFYATFQRQAENNRRFGC